MCLESAGHLVRLEVNHFDFTVRAADYQLLATLVKVAAVGDHVADVDGADLLDCTDVPDFDDAVAVCRCDVLAANRKLGVIDRVQMSVESLHGKSSAHVPDRNSLVSGPRDEKIRERLEVESVHGIGMLSELLPHFKGVQVVQFDSTIAARRQCKVACVVELDSPDWSSVYVRKGMREALAYEVPELQVAVAACRDQMRARWMEVHR